MLKDGASVMKRLITFALLFLSLLTTVVFASANEPLNKNKTNLNQATTDQGITLNIDSYSIKENKLKINFTIEDKEGYELESGGQHVPQLIERPDVVIAGKLRHATSVMFLKTSEQKYTGSSEIELPNDLPKQFNVEFNTDVILNQSGNWTIKFKIK